MIRDNKIDFWINNNLNVLLKGKHGIGKTQIIKESFERHGLNWLYFSCATMDPWVDFVGIPTKFTSADGTRYLDFVRPQAFQEDRVQAIFFDEFNRGKPKVQNAVMELIQFRSINGRKFNNLRMIWAAINPDEDDEDEDNQLEYSVEKLDPAIKDRFHINVALPYKPSRVYFKKKYGEMGLGAIEWWDELTKKHKDLISPRRLDYALEIHQMNGDIRDVIEKKTNVSKLIARLNEGPIIETLNKLFTADQDTVSKEFKNMNFTNSAISKIMDNDDYIKKFSEYIPNDILSDLITSSTKQQREKILKHTKSDKLEEILPELISANLGDKSLKSDLEEIAEARNVSSVASATFDNAVNWALAVVDQQTTQRHQGLISLTTHFKDNSENIQIYEKVIKFLILVALHSNETTIKQTSSSPIRALSLKIKNKLAKALKNTHNTTINDLYPSVYASLNTNQRSMVDTHQGKRKNIQTVLGIKLP